MRPLALLALLAAPLAAAQPMQTAAAPAAGLLRASASGDPADVAFDVRAAVLSPVDGCAGYVNPDAPDAVVDWDGGDLRVWVRAPFDATLLVHGPDDEWTCNDDAEGTSPVVRIEDAPAGRYVVWLGSFSPNPSEQAVTLYAGAPPPAPTLDAAAPPAAGTLEPTGGFEAARGGIEVNVDAGGPDAAADLDLPSAAGVFSSCAGYIDADRPTAAVRYTAEGGTDAFVVSAYSAEADLTLVVQDPEGDISCNDDFNGTDPTVVFNDPEGGVYVVWVGTFNALLEPASATLMLSETEPEVYSDFVEDGEVYEDSYGAPFSEGSYIPLDLNAVPAARLALDGSGPVSAMVSIRLSGPNPVQGDACRGAIEPTPTAGVTLSGDGPITLVASADTDLVLLVQTPGGTWYCSDDAVGLNPGVQFDDPEDGLYKVWVGAFGETAESIGAELTAERGVLRDAVDVLDSPAQAQRSQSGGTYDGTEIRPGEAATTVDAQEVAEVPVEAGGPVRNPVEGPACAGFVSERPAAEIRADGPIEVSASSDDVDLTLVVQTPDGDWYCSDDADGRDPRVVVDSGGSGPYSVWVGTFSRRDTSPPATLTFGPVLPPPPPAPIRN